MSFIKWTPDDDISNTSPLKGSAVRAVRAQISEQFPSFPLDDFIPSKAQLNVSKCSYKVSIYSVAGTPLFFQFRSGPFIPHLKLLHQFPAMLPIVRADDGAVRPVCKGADVMAPGLLAEGALPEASFEVGDYLAVHAYGKQTAFAICEALQTPEEIVTEHSGPALKTLHVLGDGLYTTSIR
jgi:predicted RNA-binding protein (TIGR00451 family)